jgi:hypothetical protein
MPGAKVPLLLPNVGSTFRLLYKCSNKSCLYYSIIINFCSYVVAEDNSKICSSCKKNKMVRKECLVGPRLSFTSDGYVDRTAIYMVMDGLEVKVLSTNSFVTLFKEFNVDEIVDIEEKVVFFGMDEVWQLSLAFCGLLLPNASFAVSCSLFVKGSATSMTTYYNYFAFLSGLMLGCEIAPGCFSFRDCFDRHLHSGRDH